jgi:hypothetical protein
MAFHVFQVLSAWGGLQDGSQEAASAVWSWKEEEGFQEER